MQKLLIFILVLAVVGAVAYAVYRYYLPSKIAESLTSGQKSTLVPEEVQKKVAAFKTKITQGVGNLPPLMDEVNIGYDDLKTMLDRLDPGEVSSALREMSSVTISSAGQAFDIVTKHVHIEGYELERFREMFIRNSDVEEIRKIAKKVSEHETLVTMGMPVAIEVAKDILESSRQEIERRLDALETSHQGRVTGENSST